jgi:hypothetical protein
MLLSGLSAQGSKFLGQGVGLWPPGYGPSGVHFVIYQLYEAETHILDETSPGSMISYSPDPSNAITWRCDIGNFNGGVNPWAPGDTLIILGSFDTVYVTDPTGYGSRQDHTGFCWIYSDTVSAANPEAWLPPDSLRVMPKPLVSMTGTGSGANDTIWIRIPNPQETRRPDQIDYDVLGYWIWADTTGTGTPDAFYDSKAVEIGFVPVQGVYGDTTTYWQLESELFLPWAHWTTYFAHKIVARPDAALADAPPADQQQTFYFSQNSDAVDIYQIMVGTGESEQTHVDHATCHASPNPFSEQTVLSFTIVEPTHVKIILLNILGQRVTTVCDDVRQAGVHRVNISGDALAAGVYYYRFEISDAVQTGRLVLLH